MPDLHANLAIREQNMDVKTQRKQGRQGYQQQPQEDQG
jgi:hypothetical protein